MQLFLSHPTTSGHFLNLDSAVPPQPALLHVLHRKAGNFPVVGLFAPGSSRTRGRLGGAYTCRRRLSCKSPTPRQAGTLAFPVDEPTIFSPQLPNSAAHSLAAADRRPDLQLRLSGILVPKAAILLRVQCRERAKPRSRDKELGSKLDVLPDVCCSGRFWAPGPHQRPTLQRTNRDT